MTGAASDVIAFDAGGEERWRVTLGQGSARTPAIVDGRIIVGTDQAWIVSLADSAEIAPRQAHISLRVGRKGVLPWYDDDSVQRCVPGGR